ncbi:hypothetical protein J3A83DRAFT_4188657 [Scleroderma citrinum]
MSRKTTIQAVNEMLAPPDVAVQALLQMRARENRHFEHDLGVQSTSVSEDIGTHGIFLWSVRELLSRNGMKTTGWKRPVRVTEQGVNHFLPAASCDFVTFIRCVTFHIWVVGVLNPDGPQDGILQSTDLSVEQVMNVSMFSLPPVEYLGLRAEVHQEPRSAYVNLFLVLALVEETVPTLRMNVMMEFFCQKDSKPWGKLESVWSIPTSTGPLAASISLCTATARLQLNAIQGPYSSTEWNSPLHLRVHHHISPTHLASHAPILLCSVQYSRPVGELKDVFVFTVPAVSDTGVKQEVVQVLKGLDSVISVDELVPRRRAMRDEF